MPTWSPEVHCVAKCFADQQPQNTDLIAKNDVFGRFFVISGRLQRKAAPK
jgi:hypothetical protein